MATLVIKSFPAELHARLKQTAAEHRRSVTQETIYLLEQALSGIHGDGIKSATPSYWENRNLLPDFKTALDRGAFSGGTDSTEIVSDDRDGR